MSAMLNSVLKTLSPMVDTKPAAAGGGGRATQCGIGITLRETGDAGHARGSIRRIAGITGIWKSLQMQPYWAHRQYTSEALSVTTRSLDNSQR